MRAHLLALAGLAALAACDSGHPTSPGAGGPSGAPSGFPISVRAGDSLDLSEMMIGQLGVSRVGGCTSAAPEVAAVGDANQLHALSPGQTVVTCLVSSGEMEIIPTGSEGTSSTASWVSVELRLLVLPTDGARDRARRVEPS